MRALFRRRSSWAVKVNSSLAKFQFAYDCASFATIPHLVLFDFNAQGERELSVRRGDVVHVSEIMSNGWSLALRANGAEQQQQQHGNSVGLVPSTYLEEIPDALLTAPFGRPAPYAPLLPRNNSCTQCKCNLKQVMLQSNGRRSCEHFLNQATSGSCCCCAQPARPGQCAICFTPYHSIALFPDLRRETRAWFKLADLNGNGKLSKQEVWAAAIIMLPRPIAENFHELWRVWDKDGDGELCFAEVCNGLLPALAPPRLRNQSDLADWFQHWDHDQRGALSKQDICQALTVTLALPSLSAHEMHGILHSIWPAFDPEGLWEITLQRFTEPGVGLGECLLASLLDYK